MTSLNVLFALFAVYMLVRYAPRAARLFRRGEPRASAVVSLLNVLLALAILTVAVLLLSVKWLGGSPISR